MAALPLSLLLAAAPMPLLSQEPLRPPSSDFVFTENSLICHAEISISFEANLHLDMELEVDRAARMGCETRRGPGGVHFEALEIVPFGSGGPAAESGECTGYHAIGATHPDAFSTHVRTAE